MIADRYEILDEIGRGAMGVVHRARDLQLERTVALKRVSAAVAADPQLRARFVREAHALARVGHPAVVSVYDVGVDGDRPWLVMELCPGGALADRLAQGPLPVPETRELIRRVASALTAIHAAGIVHRDITPGNVLMGREGWVVGDFGVAAASGETAITRTGVVLGTPEYWAPEVMGEATVGPPADVYSLGCVAFQALTGRPPYVGGNPLRVGMMHVSGPPPRLPSAVRREDPALADLVESMLAKDPGSRPTAADLAGEATRRVGIPTGRWARGARGLRTAATRVRPRPSGGRRGRRAVAATALVAAIVGGGATALGLALTDALRDGHAESFVTPALRGLTPDDAQRRLERAASDAGALVPETRLGQPRYSRSVASGRVVAQRPRAGRTVRSDDRVLLVVSRGTPVTTVPEVPVDAPPGEAIKALKARDLTVRVVEEPSFDVEAGDVIGTDPEAGASVERPATVEVRVSSGVPMAVVPTLVDVEEGSALGQLEAAGLEGVVVYEDTDSAEPGTVVGQDPAPGTSVEQRTEVVLRVASPLRGGWDDFLRLLG